MYATSGTTLALWPELWSPQVRLVGGMVLRAMQEAHEERVLVLRAKGGDKQALGSLLVRHGPQLYRSVLLPRLGSDALAKDALSETYAKVIAHIDQFEWQDRGFYPWLRTIALRVAIDLLRARKRTLLFAPEDIEREIDDCGEENSAEHALSEQRDRSRARQKVEGALQKLNPRYREVIRRRVLEEEPRDVLAQALGISPATFDVLLHRALTALKKALSSEERTSG